MIIFSQLLKRISRFTMAVSVDYFFPDWIPVLSLASSRITHWRIAHFGSLYPLCTIVIHKSPFLHDISWYLLPLFLLLPCLVIWEGQSTAAEGQTILNQWWLIIRTMTAIFWRRKKHRSIFPQDPWPLSVKSFCNIFNNSRPKGKAMMLTKKAAVHVQESRA